MRIDPDRLIKHSLTFDQVVQAVQDNNRNVGGGSIREGNQMALVHGVGRTVDVEQIGNIVITAQAGVPIRVRDVADVQIGHEIRRGPSLPTARAKWCSAWALCSWVKTPTR